MIVALDVGYGTSPAGEVGRCGIVAFSDWTSAVSLHEEIAVVDDVQPYVSGQLFERELPCLLAGLAALSLKTTAPLAAVLVDGNVRLDAQGSAGLGQHLYEHLGADVPVIGVAKNPYAGLDAVEVKRGTSDKPLYVTAAGMDEAHAAKLVATMAGDFRLPTMLRRADQLSRGSSD